MCDIPGPWWVIHEHGLIKLLQRVAEGEDPELVYMEAFANAAPVQE